MTPPVRRPAPPAVSRAHRWIPAALCLALAAARLGAQSVTIGSGPPADPPGYGAPMGNDVVRLNAVGQSFVAPGGGPVRLDEVRFWFRNVLNPFGTFDFRSLRYRLTVAPFDAATRRVAGPAAYVSQPRLGFASTAATAVTFAPEVTLAPGQLYLAFLAPEDDPPGEPVLLTPRIGQALGFATDAYSAGRAYTVRYQSAPPGPGLLAEVWTAPAGDADLAFEATFAAVPEPATLATTLTGAAALALGAARRRPRRRA